MTYKVNGTELTLQPTTGRWLPRQRLSYAGTGHPVYTGVREFELTWQLVSPTDFNQLVGFFNAVGTTGTAVIELPQFGADSYKFFAYSGCVVGEPEVGAYFTEHQLEAVLVLTNIRT